MKRRRTALVLLVACLPATAFVPAPPHGAWVEPRRRGHDVVLMAKKKPKGAAGAAAAEVRRAARAPPPRVRARASRL